MHDFAFYNVGCAEPRGPRRAVVPLRRLLRRILRPMLFRQAELFRQQAQDLERLDREARRLAEALEQKAHEFDALAARQDQLDRQVKALAAFGWDHAALARRLAALEDHAIAAGAAAPAGDAEPKGLLRAAN